MNRNGTLYPRSETLVRLAYPRRPREGVGEVDIFSRSLIARPVAGGRIDAGELTVEGTLRSLAWLSVE